MDAFPRQYDEDGDTQDGDAIVPDELFSLPPDVLVKVLGMLSTHDLADLKLCSRKAHAACQVRPWTAAPPRRPSPENSSPQNWKPGTRVQDERVWLSLCQREWGGLTDVQQWLPPPGAAPPPAHLRAPASYQELYQLLRVVEPLAEGGGLWRVIGDGPAGALATFSWTRDSVDAHEVRFRALHAPPERRPLLSICPRRGLRVGVEWDDPEAGLKATLTQHRGEPGGGRGGGLWRAASCDAVAEVGLGGGSPASSSLGTSPQGSFEHAWLHFMSGNVAQPSRQRRRAPSAGPPLLHHLVRVPTPPPSRRHALAGLWAGAHLGPGGVVRVFRVVYDFKGLAPRLVAEALVGDAAVPAGRRAWIAAVGRLADPLGEEDESLLGEFREETAARHLVGGGVFEEGGEGGPPPPPATPASLARLLHLRRVVSVHEATGRVPGLGGQWADARLWVHADGELSLLWLGQPFQRMPMRRVDADLAPPRPDARRGDAEVVSRRPGDL
jgi:hypothetical protein